VLFHLHRHAGGQRMRVIESGNGDDVLFQSQSFAEFQGFATEPVVADVAQTYEVNQFTGVIDVAWAFAAETDSGAAKTLERENAPSTLRWRRRARD
jgi:hypothetical protein